MKKLITLLLAGAMVFSLAACGNTASEPEETEDTAAAETTVDASEDEHVVLKLGHMRADGSSLDLDVEAFCAAVTEASGGSIEFEIYPSSSLGDYTAMIERMGLGDVDMMLASIGATLDPRMVIGYTPYLVTTWEQARHAYRDDGVIVTTTADLAMENDFRILSLYPMYFGGIGMAKEPTADITKAEAQGMKIRIPATNSWDALATSLGFLPTPMNYSDIFTALQTGVIDGTIGGGAEGYYSDFKDVIKYYMPIQDHFEMQWLCVGQPTWDKLSENQREVLTACAKDMQAQRWETAEAAQAEYEQKLADYGITVYEYTDEELAGMAAACADSVAAVCVQDYGEELYAALLADIEG